MTRQRFIDWLHNVAQPERYSVLRRWHGRARAGELWAFSRDSVARGVAVGFFFGILTPVAQIVFAILAGIAVRANLVVAAGSTLITNPFTLPFVYLYAFRVGAFVTGRDLERNADIAASEEAAAHALDVPGWIPTLLDWSSSVGIPLLIGVLSVAITLSVTGYLLIHLGWALAAWLRRN